MLINEHHMTGLKGMMKHQGHKKVQGDVMLTVGHEILEITIYGDCIVFASSINKSFNKAWLFFHTFWSCWSLYIDLSYRYTYLNGAFVLRQLVCGCGV